MNLEKLEKLGLPNKVIVEGGKSRFANWCYLNTAIQVYFLIKYLYLKKHGNIDNINVSKGFLEAEADVYTSENAMSMYQWIKTQKTQSYGFGEQDSALGILQILLTNRIPYQNTFIDAIFPFIYQNGRRVKKGGFLGNIEIVQPFIQPINIYTFSGKCFTLNL